MLSVEFRKLAHSRWMLGMMLFCVLLPSAFYRMSLEGRTEKNAFVFWDDRIDSTFLEIRDALSEIATLHNPTEIMHLDMSGAYWIHDVAIAALSPGGELYEKFGDYDIISKVEYVKMVDGYVFDADEEQTMPKFAVRALMADISSISFISMILPLFFFGKDFSNRTYNGALYIGYSRERILAAKLVAFLAVGMCASLIEMCMAVRIVPYIFELPPAYLLRCFAVRLWFNMALLLIPTIFPFIFKDTARALAANIVFVMLTLSNISAIPSGLLFPSISNAWKALDSPQQLFTMLAHTLVLPVISVTSAFILFRRADLK